MLIFVVCVGELEEFGICIGLVVLSVIEVFVLLELMGKFNKLLLLLLIMKLLLFNLNWFVCVNEKLWDVILGIVVKKLLFVIVKLSEVLVNWRLFWENCWVIFWVSILLFILVLLFESSDVV